MILFVNFNTRGINFFASISEDIILTHTLHDSLQDRVDVPVRPDIKCIFFITRIVPLSFSTSSIAEIDVEIEIPVFWAFVQVSSTCWQIF